MNKYRLGRKIYNFRDASLWLRPEDFHKILYLLQSVQFQFDQTLMHRKHLLTNQFFFTSCSNGNICKLFFEIWLSSKNYAIIKVNYCHLRCKICILSKNLKYRTDNGDIEIDFWTILYLQNPARKKCSEVVNRYFLFLRRFFLPRHAKVNLIIWENINNNYYYLARFLSNIYIHI